MTDDALLCVYCEGPSHHSVAPERFLPREAIFFSYDFYFFLRDSNVGGGLEPGERTYLGLGFLYCMSRTCVCTLAASSRHVSFTKTQDSIQVEAGWGKKHAEGRRENADEHEFSRSVHGYVRMDRTVHRRKAFTLRVFRLPACLPACQPASLPSSWTRSFILCFWLVRVAVSIAPAASSKSAPGRARKRDKHSVEVNVDGSYVCIMKEAPPFSACTAPSNEAIHTPAVLVWSDLFFLGGGVAPHQETTLRRQSPTGMLVFAALHSVSSDLVLSSSVVCSPLFRGLGGAKRRCLPRCRPRLRQL